jgi:hypothetical protein
VYINSCRSVFAHYLRHERRRSECFICAIVPNMSSLKRTLCLICRIPFVNRMLLVHAIAIELIAIYSHSFEIFIIQIGEMAFCKPEFIIKSNYFQKAQKAFALVHERRFRALVRHNGVRPCNVILKVLSSKRFFSSK